MGSGIQTLFLTIAQQVFPTTGHLSTLLRDSESESRSGHPGVADTSVLKVNSSAFEYLGNSVAFKTGEKSIGIGDKEYWGKRNGSWARGDLQLGSPSTGC